MNKVFVPLIIGTARKDSQTEKVGKYIFEYLSEREDLETELLDAHNYEMGLGDEASKKIAEYSEAVERADGFLVVSPEYNHSFPGSLKMLLDLEYDNYRNKAVGVCGVSNGPWGGTRMIESLIPILKCVGMKQTQKDLQVTFCKEFPEKKDENFDERMESMVDELVWLADTLKKGRNSL